MANRLGVTVGHVEAGLRSFDRSMSEEVNRVLTDQISDLLFTHSPEARGNLVREGRDEATIHEVGNTMIETCSAPGPSAHPARPSTAPAGWPITPGFCSSIPCPTIEQ